MAHRVAWLCLGALGFGLLACGGEGGEPEPDPTGGATASGGSAAAPGGGAPAGGTGGAATSGGAPAGGQTTGGAASGGMDAVGGSLPTTGCNAADGPLACSVTYDVNGMQTTFVGVMYCVDGTWTECMYSNDPPP